MKFKFKFCRDFYFELYVYSGVLSFSNSIFEDYSGVLGFSNSVFSGSSGVLSFSNFVFRPSDGVSPARTYSGVSEKQILCFTFFASFFWILSIFWIVRTFWIVRLFTTFRLVRTFLTFRLIRIVRLFQTFRHCDKFHKLIVRVIWKLLKLSENLNFIYFWFFYWHRISSLGII